MTKDKEKTFYSAEELVEFEILIKDKWEKSNRELLNLKSSISRSNGNEDANWSGTKVIEDGAEASEKEQINQLAARTQKYMKQLENALARIKNGTYGVCLDSGKLISKERLRAVPHTQYSIEAKKEQATRN